MLNLERVIMKTQKTVLITGGAGFIGANLVRKLITQKENSIHIVTEKNSSLWRLGDILSSLAVHEIDLTDFEQIRTLVHAIKPSIIFHLAAYGGMCTQSEQKQIFDVNFYGTVNLLNACKDVGFECFINTGSSSEYGMQDEPMKETLALEPVSDYAVAKAAATQFCLKEARFNKLPIYTIRPFSVYGDYEMPKRLIPTIIVQALQGQPIQLSSPHFVRDYIYISDMVNLYLMLAEQKPNKTSDKPYIFNGGTGVQSSIQDVVTTVQKLVSKKLDVVWGASEPRPWEPKAWRADITHANTLLGWQPVFTLEDGLKVSLAWFEKNMTQYKSTIQYPNIPFMVSNCISNRIEP